ncbi:hypothetical protein [Microbispora sp. NPDC049633]|uniref:hypothetical protein n=1 Tax=Microbispora sp. NPDC049633 TaxID=3154355 RepID=UPI003448F26F
MSKLHRASRRQEDQQAAKIGGSRNAASGALDFRKNDVRNETESWELKYTTAKQYTLRLADLLEAEKQALLDNGRLMRFGLRMGDRDWVILSQEDYDMLKEEAL